MEQPPEGRERWGASECEALLTSVLKRVCQRKSSDWFRLISQQLGDSATEDTVEFLLCFQLITVQHGTDKRLINTTCEHTHTHTLALCLCVCGLITCLRFYRLTNFNLIKQCFVFWIISWNSKDVNHLKIMRKTKR